MPAPPLGEGLHVVALSVADKAGNGTSLTWRFTTDTGAPVVTDAAPRNTLVATATPLITATYQDSTNGTGIDLSRVSILVDGAEPSRRTRRSP